MTQIIFYTPTILPKACLFTMGVSAKETEHPIGFFGTGLKYAIAVCMRLGAEVDIQCTVGGSIAGYQFRAVEEDVRGKTFRMIDCCVTGEWQRMPMTLDYGKTWEPWMALRELYSNTVDENGEMWEDIDGMRSPHYPRDREGTYIIVTCEPGSDLETAWVDRHGTWLINPRWAPVWENEHLQIFLRPSSVLYYKGIRVSQKGFESAVTYNLLRDHTLTEDRTLDLFDFNYYYQTDIAKISQRDAARRILEASGNEKMAESKMHLNRVCTPESSEQMREEAIRVYRSNPDLLSTSAKAGVQAYMRKHNFDELYTAAKVTQEEQRRYDECLQVLYDAGFKLHKYRIRISDMDDSNVQGLADSNTNTIVLNVAILRGEDWKELTCCVLMEEYIHLEFGVDDYTRTMQTQLLKLLYDVITSRKVRNNDTMAAGLLRIAIGPKKDTSDSTF